MPPSKFGLPALKGVEGAALAIWVARGPRGPGRMRGPGGAGRPPGRLPGAPRAQAHHQEQQGREQGQARGAEELQQQGLQREAVCAR